MTRSLKSGMSCLALLVVLGQAALAGSFTVIVADTALSDTLGSEVVYNMRVANVSGSDLTLAMVLTVCGQRGDDSCLWELTRQGRGHG